MSVWIVVYSNQLRAGSGDYCDVPRPRAQKMMRHNNHGSSHADKLQKSSLVIDNTSKQHNVQAV